MKTLPYFFHKYYYDGKMYRAILILAWALPLTAAPFSGRILDARNGAPVYSALVRVIRPSPHEVIAELETDRAGNFAGDEIPSGDYRLEISKNNFQPTVTDIHWDSTALAPMSIRLLKLGAIAGRVLDAQGAPLRDAMVYTFTVPMAGSIDVIGGPVREHSNVHPDAAGQYRIHGLRPGRYAVGVVHDSGVALYPNNTAPQMFDVLSGEEYRADFSIATGVTYKVHGTIHGTIDGDAKGGYGVTLVTPGMRSVAIAQQWTAGKNTFQFDHVPPGSYDVLAAGPMTGYGVRAITVDDTPVYGRIHVDVNANVDDVHVAMAPGKSLSLKLEEPPLGCQRGAKAWVTPAEDWGVLATHNVSLTPGNAEKVTGLAPGPYWIVSADPSADCVLPSGLAEAGGTVGVSLQLNASISGIVKSAGDLLLTSLDPYSTEPSRVVSIDREHRYSIGRLRPGRYALVLSNVENSVEAEITVFAGEHKEVDLHLPEKKETP